MALVNPNIAMSFRQPDIQAPNALAQYAQIQQIQGGRQAQELNALKMQEAQAAMEERNALAGAYSQSIDPKTGKIDYNKLTGFLASGPGASQIPAIEKTRRELENATLDQQTKSTKLLADKLALLPEAYKRADTPEAYLQLHQSVHADPVIGPWLKSVGATPEKGLANLQNAVQTGKFDDLRLKSMQSVSQILDSMKPQVVAPGSTLVQGGKPVFTAPAAPPGPTTLARLQNELAALPPGDPRRAQYEALILKEITPVAGTTIKLPPQENAFESELGKGQSKRILANQEAAYDAAEILRTNQVGRDLLEAGAITGTGADFLVGLNNALKQVGIDFGYADAAANSQAYVATLGANVGRIIKQFGAGTGLSDADRDFAEKIAGGKIALTETALRRILDINDRASNRVIDLHNKNVSGIKTNIPLTVEKPVFQRPAPSAANQIPGNAPAPAAAPAARTVVRTGTLNGRRVIQYSDGSTEYGN